MSLATGYQILKEYPDKKWLLLEKEKDVDFARYTDHIGELIHTTMTKKFSYPCRSATQVELFRASQPAK